MDNRINFKLPLIENFESAYDICKRFLETKPVNDAKSIKTFLETGLKDEATILAILKKEYEQRKEKAGDNGKEHIIKIMRDGAYSIIDFNAMKFELYQKIEEINHYQLVDKKVNFSGAFEIYSKILDKKEKRKLLISIAIDKGFRAFIEFLDEEIESFTTEEENIESEQLSNDFENNIKSTRIKLTDLHQRDFLKLIYALHYAGKINSGTGEITKIVEEIADRLDYKLGKSWQSNISKGIHNSNNDFETGKIFDELKTAFSKNYRDDKRKKTKNQ
ncbi:MAG: hypothetical protein V4506_06550 [Bacteroidota bacterium]